jgi:hypothetical protein
MVRSYGLSVNSVYFHAHLTQENLMLLKRLCAWAWCVVCMKLRAHTLWDALVSSIFQSVCLDVDYQLRLHISNTIITGHADVHICA